MNVDCRLFASPRLGFRWMVVEWIDSDVWNGIWCWPSAIFWFGWLMAWHWKIIMTRGGKPAGVELSRTKIVPIISTDGDWSEEDIRIQHHHHSSSERNTLNSCIIIHYTQSNRIMMLRSALLVWLWASLMQVAAGQDYNEGGSGDPYYEQEYAQDNLYHDYAARQQEKAEGWVWMAQLVEVPGVLKWHAAGCECRLCSLFAVIFSFFWSKFVSSGRLWAKRVVNGSGPRVDASVDGSWEVPFIVGVKRRLCKISSRPIKKHWYVQPSAQYYLFGQPPWTLHLTKSHEIFAISTNNTMRMSIPCKYRMPS